MNTKAYAALDKDSELTLHPIQRRQPGPHDVAISIEYCGVCHSDIHKAHDDWGGSQYPLVPGHEIIGRVVSVGNQVTQYNKGDLVGVGCMVDSCRTCNACEQNLEQYCENEVIFTYDAPDHISGGLTYGGYSESIVVDENYVVRVAESLDTQSVAPLLCAGITMYSPLRQWQVKPGERIGIIGLGGLGHIGVKLAVAMQAEVTVITSSADKAKEAQQLGAQHTLISLDQQAMENAACSFDLLINTIPVSHDVNPYLNLLKLDKTMVVVGSLTPLTEVSGAGLILKRRRMAGSVIGGIAETQEMLDFCAEHNITCDVEMIAMQDINQAFTRVMNADVKYRFVIDMQSLKQT